jgi:hypothetical protein
LASMSMLLVDGKAVSISRLKVRNEVEASDTRTGRDQAETVMLHHDTDLYNLNVKTSRGTAVIHTTSRYLFGDPVWTNGSLRTNYRRMSVSRPPTG